MWRYYPIYNNNRSYFHQYYSASSLQLLDLHDTVHKTANHLFYIAYHNYLALLYTYIHTSSLDQLAQGAGMNVGIKECKVIVICNVKEVVCCLVNSIMKIQ